MATVYGFAIYGADLLTRLGAPGGNRAILAALFLLDTLIAASVAFFDIGLSAKNGIDSRVDLGNDHTYTVGEHLGA